MNVDLLCLFTPIYLMEIVSPIKGNCFKTSHLLMENTFGRAPKFVWCGNFLWQWVTIDVLIELSLMVPFASIVPFVQSKSTFAADFAPPLTLATAA